MKVSECLVSNFISFVCINPSCVSFSFGLGLGLGYVLFCFVSPSGFKLARSSGLSSKEGNSIVTSILVNVYV
ncbi:uncharacterized protein P174DRAFT_250220 [Aspergillus novofumigatus IBT 16806]|uniref:Uncharacterized protein n=1 Tax=Aspergillus novofumigatus (strain IBT 16806) TaxID=1392255 RepID=A0A2I1C2I9_ASPN1|nr:uncharacterized protein P174DRAFT_250220 [Aspergillus novofumigatus IBT 16806]PKX91803.1 hypothetical protein P174DRAFT_250220 [Aspergillus novofumigatus IBT 16806]